jgi:hypothetical protein
LAIAQPLHCASLRILFEIDRPSSIALIEAVPARYLTKFFLLPTSTPEMARRGSSMFAPTGAPAGGPAIDLGEFEDDYESEEEPAPKAPIAKVPPANNPGAPGGRPMVGGFAAAAYEAAKAHHFAQQQAKAKAAASKARGGH